MIARVGCRESQGFSDGSLFIWQFEDAAFSAGTSVEYAATTFLAQLKEMIVAASGWVCTTLLLFFLALGRGSNDDDGDW